MEVLETLNDGSFRKLLILKNKDGSGYQFINLQKRHICPCKFKTQEEALEDLNRLVESGKIKEYVVI